MKILNERQTFFHDYIPVSEITYLDKGEVKVISVLRSSVKELEEEKEDSSKIWKGLAIGFGILSLILIIKKK